jgi:hypothetical protein
MSGNLEFIEELGMSEPISSENTESPEQENTPSSPEEDFVQEPTEQTVDTKEETQEDTEPNELDDKEKAIMQKRIDDKEAFIQKQQAEIDRLRAESKEREESLSKEEVVDEEDEFWEDPVAKYKELQRTVQLQQMQIQETVYANTVEDYWKTVNPDALKEAVATDTKFAEEFNGSKEPYKTAYEYLSAKKTQKVQSETALREQIRKELLAEMGKDKPKKETVPSIQAGSSGTKNTAPEDGFSAVFGG